VQRVTTAELPITLKLVLGNGAHCGDVVALSQLDAFAKELDILAAAADRCERLSEFLVQMRELVAAARAESNPIYFG
jgi:hypothetical protein